MYIVDDAFDGLYGPFSSKESVWKFILKRIGDDYDHYFNDKIKIAIRDFDLDFIIDYENDILEIIEEDISYKELQAPY